MDDRSMERGHVDVLPLVLGHLAGSERAAVAAHLLVCGECRRDYDELSASLGETLDAVPEVQPPLGFDQRVLAGMRPSGRSSCRGSVARWATRAAAVAAAVAVLVVGIAWFTSSRDGSIADSSVSTLELAGGRQVGTVSVGHVEGDTVMVVALVTAPAGMSYRCRTTFTDGTTVESPPWPASNLAWIVPLPDGSRAVRKVELVADTNGEVWSSADFSQ